MKQKGLYVNVYDYLDNKYPFQIFVGGRGCGKTYGALRGVLPHVEQKLGDRFILMRRTGEELDLLIDRETGDSANPFKSINRDDHTNYGLSRINRKLAGIYEREEVDGVSKCVGAPIGYGVALSTIANMRGADFSDCTDLIYDEFIPERHVHKIKNECDAFLNAYETFNRNREFYNLPPMRVWMLSNSNDIYNPIFKGLGIVDTIERMIRKGKTDLYLEERGLALHLLAPSEEFVQKKSSTAVARLSSGTNFYEMAYGNGFSYNDFSNVGYRNLTGYQPVCAMDDMYVYRKKGSREIYVSYSPCRTQQFHSTVDHDVIRFRQEYGVKLYPYYIEGSMIFESYDLKESLLQYIL